MSRGGHDARHISNKGNTLHSRISFFPHFSPKIIPGLINFRYEPRPGKRPGSRHQRGGKEKETVVVRTGCGGGGEKKMKVEFELKFRPNVFPAIIYTFI